MPGMNSIPDAINLNLRFELGIVGSNRSWRKRLHVEGCLVTPVVMEYHVLLSQSILRSLIIQTASG